MCVVNDDDLRIRKEGIGVEENAVRRYGNAVGVLVLGLRRWLIPSDGASKTADRETISLLSLFCDLVN